jgi:hypothetical protein
MYSESLCYFSSEQHTLPNMGLDHRERGFVIAKQRPKEEATVSCNLKEV